MTPRRDDKFAYIRTNDAGERDHVPCPACRGTTRTRCICGGHGCAFCSGGDNECEECDGAGIVPRAVADDIEDE